MTATWYVFDTGTLGATPVAGADGEAFNAPGGGSIVYDNTHVLNGTRSLKITPASGQVADVLVKSGINSNQMSLHVGFWYDALSTSDEEIFRIEDTANSRMLGLARAGSGKLSLTDKTSTAPRLWIGTANPPVSQWIVAKLWMQIGAATATGSVKLGFYNLDGTVLGSTSGGLDTPFTSSAASLGTVNIGRYFIGRTGTQTTTEPRWFDTVGHDPAATDFISFSGPPTANLAVLDNLARITVTASGGTGPFTYSISPSAGTISDGTGVWLVPKPTTNPVTYSMTVTDATSQTSAPVTKTIDPATTSAVVWPKRPTGTLPTTTWG